MLLEPEQKEGYQATVKIEEEGSSLIVQMSLKATWGRSTSPDLCSFYDEFAKNVKEASLRAKTKQLALSSQKPSEGVKELPLVVLCQPAPSPPTPAAAPKMSSPILPQGKVVWVYVNLRDGPGIQNKIIGKAYMKNSFRILAENPGWLRVRLENGVEGWMSKKAVILDKPMASPPQTPLASSPDPSGSQISSKPLSPM